MPDNISQEADDRQAPPPNIGMLLRTVLQAFRNALNEELVLAEFSDVTPAHSNVFGFIGAEGSRLTELAARAQLTKQSMQALVDYLEQRGYVERVSDPTDARAKLIRLTAKGWAVIPRGENAIVHIEQRWEGVLGSERYQQLRQLLSELVAAETSARHI